jgi:radical SAM protein with 4Fe4S-binding SPASM domain
MLPKSKKVRMRKEGTGSLILVEGNTLFLNKPAYAILLLLNGKNTPGDIARKINIHFKVGDIERVERDTNQMIEKFKEYGLLEGFPLKIPFGNSLPQRPTYITWCITKKCNLTCRHCYIDYSCQETTRDELMVILEKIKKTRPFLVILTGGEPLMRDEVFFILDTLKRLRTDILFETNGTLITDDNADKISECCPSAQVSIYSSSEKTHDDMTGVEGAFRKMMKGVSLLRERGVDIRFNCVLHRENVDEIQEITELALKHGDRIKFNTIDLLGRSVHLKNLAFSKGEYKKAMELIRFLQEQHQEERILVHLPYIHLKDGLYAFDRSICTAGLSGFMIDFDGTAKLCEKVPLEIGNVIQQDMNDIWNSPIIEDMRNITEKIRGKCSSCTFLSVCKGGCRGETYIRAHDLYGEDPLCWIGDNDVQ